jgi:DNA polymerase-3 subunit chi
MILQRQLARAPDVLNDRVLQGWRSAMAETSEVLFYHLERQPLERVLPGLLEKTLQRGWRAVVQAGSAERLEALDAVLWTYSDESFLAHGTAADGHADAQPIFLTLEPVTPNGAGVRFLVDGADAPDYETHIRLVYLFDGNDEDAKAHARQQWAAAKAAGCKVSYWKQSPEGRWENKA